MTTVARSLAISLFERYVLVILGLVSSVFVARLLTPEEIGIFSVSMAFLGIAQVLRDFGVVSYLIQVRDLTEDHVRSAFGVSLVLGVTLCGLLIASAPLVSSFYSEPRLHSVLYISALNFLVLPFGTISLALLRREMQFQKVLYANVTGGVLGFLATIGAAYIGLGPESLALGALVTNLGAGVAAWLTRSGRRLIRPSLSRARELISYGAPSSLANVVTTISMDINDLAIGKLMGFGPVAIISRAQGVMNIFHKDVMSAVRNVALPAYSKSNRCDLPIEPQYVESVASVTAVAWPFYAFCSLYALELLRLLFGPQWDAAAPLVVIFCIGGAVAATSNLASTTIIAVGRIGVASAVDLVFQPLRAVLIVSAAMVFKSLAACAIAYSVSWVVFVPVIYYAKSLCLPSDWRGLAIGMAQSFALMVVALAPPIACRILIGEGVISMLIAAGLCVMAWFGGLWLTHHPLMRSVRQLRTRSVS